MQLARSAGKHCAARSSARGSRWAAAHRRARQAGRGWRRVGSRHAGKPSARPRLRTRVLAGPLAAGRGLLLLQQVLLQRVQLQQVATLLQRRLDCRAAALLRLRGQQGMQQGMLVRELLRSVQCRLLLCCTLLRGSGGTLLQ